MPRCSCAISRCIHLDLQPTESVIHFCTERFSCKSIAQIGSIPVHWWVETLLVHPGLLLSRLFELLQTQPEEVCSAVFRAVVSDRLNVVPRPLLDSVPTSPVRTRGSAVRDRDARRRFRLWSSLTQPRLGTSVLSTFGYQQCFPYLSKADWWLVWQENYLALQLFHLRRQCLRCRARWTCDLHSIGPIVLVEMPDEYWYHHEAFGDWIQASLHLVVFRFRSKAWTLLELQRLFPNLKPLNPGNRGGLSTYLMCRLLWTAMRTIPDQSQWLRFALRTIRHKFGVTTSNQARRLQYITNYFLPISEQPMRN